MVDRDTGDHPSNLSLVEVPPGDSQILELLEDRSLFEPIDLVNQQYVFPLALAQYITVLDRHRSG